MKLYTFAWCDYDSYCPHNLTHPENKTQEEFEADCKEALICCADEYLAQEEVWVGLDRWITAAVQWMTKHQGYTFPEQRYFSLSGGMIIDGKKHAYHGETAERISEDQQELLNLVGQKLFDKCVEKNRLLEEELDRKSA